MRGHEKRLPVPVRVLQSCVVGHLAVPVGALNVHGHGVVLCKQYARIVDLAQRFERHVHRRVVLAAVPIVLAVLHAAAREQTHHAKRANACFLPVFHLGFLLIWVRTHARILKLFNGSHPAARYRPLHSRRSCRRPVCRRWAWSAPCPHKARDPHCRGRGCACHAPRGSR